MPGRERQTWSAHIEPYARAELLGPGHAQRGKQPNELRATMSTLTSLRYLAAACRQAAWLTGAGRRNGMFHYRTAVPRTPLATSAVTLCDQVACDPRRAVPNRPQIIQPLDVQIARAVTPGGVHQPGRYEAPGVAGRTRPGNVAGLGPSRHSPCAAGPAPPAHPHSAPRSHRRGARQR